MLFRVSASSKPPRVAHLIQYFAIGGLERMVQLLATMSQARGVESLVVAYLGDGPIRQELQAHGVGTLLLEGSGGLAPKRCVQLWSVLSQHHIDVLHTHHVGPFIYGVPAAAALGVRRVHTEHSHELYDRGRRRAVGSMMSRLARVVAVTPEIAGYHKQQFGADCTVIRNGVQLSRDDETLRARARAELGFAPHEFVIGCVARLAREKDHATLLKAFAYLQRSEPHARLVIVGDGPEGARLRALAAHLQIASRVDWLGARDRMHELYPALDACALASKREGLPLALLEAMAHHVPVVATAVGGVPELLQGQAGVLVAPENAAQLTEALRVLSRDRAYARTLGQCGFERVAAKYSATTMVDRYIALYHGLDAADGCEPHEPAPCA